MDRAAKERAAKERAAVELLGERDPRFKQKADESEEDWLTRGRIAVQLSRKSRIVANSPPEAGEQNVGLRPSVGIRRITTKEGPNPNDGRADAAPAGRMDTTAAEPVAPPPSYDHNHDVIFTARLKETVSSLPGKTTALFGEFRNELSKHIGAIITYFVTSSEFNASIGPSSGYIILYDESRKVLIYNKNNDIARRFRSYLKNIAPDMGDRIVNILFENYSDEPISSEGLHSAILKVLIDNNNNDPDILERLFTQIDDFRTSIMPDINERERLVQQINAYIQNLRSTGAALDELAKKAAQPPIVQRNARGFRVTQKQQVTVNSSKQVVVPVPKRSWLNWMRGKPRPTQGGGTRRLTRKAGARATKSHLRATRSRRRSSGGRARTRRHG
jgi:hypothetical protein